MSMQKIRRCNLSAAEWAVWSFFVDNDKQTFDVQQLLEECNISKKSYYRSIKRLNDFGLLPNWFEYRNKNNVEDYVTEKLHTKVGGKREVFIKSGRIDILTDTELIEVKAVADWKAAIGQVISYGIEFPSHRKRIHLFGYATQEQKEMICQTTKSLNIVVTFED